MVWSNGKPLFECALPAHLDTSAHSTNTASCFINVEDGDELFVEGHFSGSVWRGRFDLLADGSFLRDRILADAPGGGIKVHNKTKVSFVDVFDTLTEEASSKPGIVEGGMVVRSLPDIEYEPLGIGDEIGVGSLVIIASLSKGGKESYDPTFPDCKSGQWMYRDLAKVREAGIAPTFDIGVKPHTIEAEPDKQSKHLRHATQKRFGREPWVRFVFYYRRREAILAAGCAPLTSAIDIPIQQPTSTHEAGKPCKKKGQALGGELKLPLSDGRQSRIGQPLNLPGKAANSKPVAFETAALPQRTVTSTPTGAAAVYESGASALSAGRIQHAHSISGESGMESLFGDPVTAASTNGGPDSDIQQQGSISASDKPTSITQQQDQDLHTAVINQESSHGNAGEADAGNEANVDAATDGPHLDNSDAFNFADVPFDADASDFGNLEWNDSAADMFEHLQVPDGTPHEQLPGEPGESESKSDIKETQHGQTDQNTFDEQGSFFVAVAEHDDTFPGLAEQEQPPQGQTQDGMRPGYNRYRPSGGSAPLPRTQPSRFPSHWDSRDPKDAYEVQPPLDYGPPSSHQTLPQPQIYTAPVHDLSCPKGYGDEVVGLYSMNINTNSASGGATGGHPANQNGSNAGSKQEPSIAPPKGQQSSSQHGNKSSVSAPPETPPRKSRTPSYTNSDNTTTKPNSGPPWSRKRTGSPSPAKTSTPSKRTKLADIRAEQLVNIKQKQAERAANMAKANERLALETKKAQQEGEEHRAREEEKKRLSDKLDAELAAAIREEKLQIEEEKKLLQKLKEVTEANDARREERARKRAIEEAGYEEYYEERGEGEVQG